MLTSETAIQAAHVIYSELKHLGEFFSVGDIIYSLHDFGWLLSCMAVA